MALSFKNAFGQAPPGGGQATGAPAGPGAKPDPMIQPALANAIRPGAVFGQFSPAGSRAGVAAKPGAQASQGMFTNTRAGAGPQVGGRSPSYGGQPLLNQQQRGYAPQKPAGAQGARQSYGN